MLALNIKTNTQCRPLQILLSLWCMALLSTFSVAQASPHKLSSMRLRIAGKMVSDTVPVRTSGGEIYAGISVLKYLGAKGKVAPRGESIMVTPANSDRAQEVALAQVEGRSMIPLTELAPVVQGLLVRPKANSDAKNRDSIETQELPRLEPLVYLLAKVRHVQVKAGVVRVETSFPVLYRVRNVTDEEPIRGYIDCIGATVSDDVITKIAPDMDKSVRKVRTGQNEEDIARVVVEFEHNQTLRISDSLDKPSELIFASLSDKPFPTKQDTNIQTPNRLGNEDSTPTKNTPSRVGRGGGVKSPKPGRGGNLRGGRQEIPDVPNTPVTLQNIFTTLEPDNMVRLELVMQGQVQPTIRYVKNHAQMVIDLPNTTMNLPPATLADQSLNYPMISRLICYMMEDKNLSTRIALDVNQSLRYRIRWLDNVLRIDLKLPEAGTGLLSGHTIVVDPGHGGHSMGASGREDVMIYEKNVALAIGLKVRSALQAMGAEVVMTRDTDVFIPLYDRPALANSIGADLFVSIHNDSTGRANQASGTTTYYHMDNSKARSLAKAVQKAIMAVSGLPSRGAVSDSVLYQNGLGVLRASNMPSILVEVAYINTDRDRKRLIDPEFQQSVADAIAEGVRNYYSGATEEDRSDPDPPRTRSTTPEKPEKEDESGPSR